MRRNSVNAIRLAFAIAILALHALPLGGYMLEMPKLIFHDTIGTYMLSGFFVISGFMITASRLASRSLRDYFWRRLLRIYPAWICSLLLVAVVLAPLSRRIEGKPGYDWSNAAGFVYRNLLFVLKQLGINGTISDVPTASVWNFSAWTLFYEFTLWVGMALLVTIFTRRFLAQGAWLGLAVFTAIEILDKITTHGRGAHSAREVTAQAASGSFLTLIEPLARLGIFFMAGSILFIYRDRVRLSPLFAWICAAICAVLAVIGYFHVFASLPWAYVIMYLGCSPRFAGVNNPDDYSYGMYIYAYPITQLVAVIALDHPMSAWLFIPLCFVLTAPLAWLSWHYVEKPVMSLKRLTAAPKAKEPIIGVP